MRRTAAIILGAACLLGLPATAATAAAPTHTATASAPIDECGNGCHDNDFNFNQDSGVGHWH